MPAAETMLMTAVQPSRPPAIRRRGLHGWGGGPSVPARVLAPWRRQDVPRALEVARDAAGHSVIARGMGRSYGDAAQLRDGFVLETTRLKGIELDAGAGRVVAEAGVTIGELLARVVPAGWMVPVVPGTQHVSVGGAIASDIHGKNHGAVGTFGSHVEALGLLRADGETCELHAGDPAMAATLGGMGLTGIVLWARLRLRAVTSALMSVDTDRVVGLDAILSALRAPGGPHRVAWLDLLSRRTRGIVTRAEHFAGAGPQGERGGATVAARATVPAAWPEGLLAPATLRAFNALRFHSAPRQARGHLEDLGRHMFPLDALRAWPRLYGPRGFVQYQLAVPPDRDDVLASVLAQLRRHHVPCYLAVLKDFGAAAPAPLSFPLEGWTLALDLPRSAPGLDAALTACDELVAQAGGRVYLAKDARVRPETLRAMYPRLSEWQRLRDEVDPERVWCSDLARRTGLVAP